VISGERGPRTGRGEPLTRRHGLRDHGPVIDPETDPDEAVVAVDLPARSWAVIDATMDDVAHNALLAYDPEAERRGTIARSIREAGRDQVPWVGPDRTWPPMTRMITISLTADQWRFAMSWVEESMSNPVDDETVELCGAALAVVRPRLPERPSASTAVALTALPGRAGNPEPAAALDRAPATGLAPVRATPSSRAAAPSAPRPA
jgi:hypothetical protein